MMFLEVFGHGSNLFVSSIPGAWSPRGDKPRGGLPAGDPDCRVPDDPWFLSTQFGCFQK